MKNFVVTVILVGVLGYVGAKFYLHHEVSSNLDTAIALVQPFADIQYQGVSSTMSGELSVDGISARFGQHGIEQPRLSLYESHRGEETERQPRGIRSTQPLTNC